MKKAAVLLSGCGFKDGSEIQESVFSLLSLEEFGFNFDCYSLNQDMTKVVHHNNDECSIEKRNILQESSRISRGDIHCLKTLNVDDYDCFIIPGGFGVGLNLSDFAIEGEKVKINEIVHSTICNFNSASKFIACICLAPILIAKTLSSKRVNITIGDNKEISSIIEKWGAVHSFCKSGSYVYDEKNRIFSTPAYMYGDAKIQDVYLGIRNMIKKMEEVINNS